MITYAENALQIIYVQCAAGQENTVRQACEKLLPAGEPYKLLGEYDLAYFGVVPWTKPVRTAALPGARIKTTLSALVSTDSLADPEHSLKCLLAESRVLAVVYLKASLSTSRAEIWSVADKIMAGDSFDCNVIATLSGGTHEIVALIGAKKVESVFQCVELWRTEFGYKLADLEIRFAFSYRRAIDKLNVTGVELGKSDVSISCFTTPGDEDLVRSQIPSVYKTYKTSGRASLVASTRGRNVTNVLQDVLELRQHLYEKKVLHRTQTQLLFSSESPSTLAREKKGASTQPLRLQAATQKALATLNTLAVNADLFPRSVEEKAAGTLYRLLAASQDVATADQVERFASCVDERIYKNLIDIQSAQVGPVSAQGLKAAGDARDTLQHILAQLTTELESTIPAGYAFGLSQRGASDDYGNRTIAATAIGRLLGTLYANLGYSEHSLLAWTGFCCPRSFSNFEVGKASIYQIPAELVLPFSGGRSWTTITHEFSHDVMKQCSMADGNSWFDTVKQLVAEKVQGTGTPIEMPMLWEWFAHWFDFVHFYQRDKEFFTHAIWASWLEKPQAMGNLDDCLMRTLAVWLSTNDTAIAEKTKAGTRKTIAKKELSDLCTFLQQNFGTEYPFLRAHLTTSEWHDDVVGPPVAYSGTLRYFEENFCRPLFARRMNWGAPEVTTAYERMLNGIPTDDMPNVIALVIRAQHELLRKRRHLTGSNLLNLRESCLRSAMPLEAGECLVITYAAPDTRLAKTLAQFEALMNATVPTTAILSVPVDLDSDVQPVDFADLQESYLYRTNHAREDAHRVWIHVGYNPIGAIPEELAGFASYVIQPTQDARALLAVIFAIEQENFWLKHSLINIAERAFLRAIPLDLQPSDISNKRSYYLSLPVAVFSVHGMKTRGEWQKTFQQQLTGVEHFPHDYGYFLLPNVQKHRTEKLRNLAKKIDEFRKKYPVRTNRQVFLAHSFGTWLVVAHLTKNPADVPHELILVAAVVDGELRKHTRFPFRLERLINLCATADPIVGMLEWRLAKKVGFDEFGVAGIRGFLGTDLQNTIKVDELNRADGESLLECLTKAGGTEMFLNVKTDTRDHSHYLTDENLGDLARYVSRTYK